jgi:hypothetical protein
MSFNTTDITNGISISGSTNPYNTYVKTENAGVYDIQFSAQLDKTDSGADEIVIWLAKNGTNLTDTATTITLSGNSDKEVAAWNWFVNSAANDYYQIIWQSADTRVRLLAEPADGHPGIPSVILTANRVDQFLSNTGSFNGSFNGNFTGSLFGTASQAISASFATSASQAVSSSFALTASHADVFTIGGSKMMYSNTPSTSAGNNGIFATNTGSFAGAFYQYTLYSGSNARSENANVVWTSITSSFTNYSTIDVGNTSGVVGSVVITGGQIQLNILTPTAGWTVRAVATFV